jgi:hypothetical protein
MNDEIGARIAVALEQIALELASRNIPAPTPAPQGDAPRFAPIGWTCPDHGTSKTVPAGVSSKTGNPYDAFVCCPERGCEQRPPRVTTQAAPARAMPPSPQQLP